jgi:hypothetical protein
MKIKNKYKPGNAVLNIGNKIEEIRKLQYKKKNRKILRINFRNFTLSGALVGINKI